MTAWIKAVPGGVRLTIRAQPNAKSSEVAGEHAGALRVKIASPPVDGAANEALLAFLAKTLGVKERQASLVQGAASRQKVVEILGVTVDHAIRVLTSVDGSRR